MTVRLRFASGTLEVEGLPQDESPPAGLVWDDRARIHRAPAIAYAEVVRALHKRLPFVDEARSYEELELSPRVVKEPRPFQAEGIAAWRANRGRGVVVLPTGAGKSHVAVMAIMDKSRSALVVAPTLDLVRQWYDLLKTTFACEVGIVGGGEHRILPLTVTTYDSAYLHMEHMGSRFGLVIFDECHHLPGESYALIARLCLAPYRLGLTATPERADGRESLLEELIGPTVFEKRIDELSGEYLADYRIERVVIDLTPSEREQYEEARNTYLGYIRSQGIAMGSPRGFSDFMMRASRTEHGRRALSAYRRQRALSLAAEGKIEYLEHLLFQHRADRTIIFTQDNATAYDVGRRFLVPVISHQTKVKERSEILGGFHEGRYRVVVTSKVLNEGVDVPNANVAVVLSGSGSVMEHVQRLGRILRKQGEKRAILYEIVSRNTSETYTSDRRREHSAYKNRARFWGKRGSH